MLNFGISTLTILSGNTVYVEMFVIQEVPEQQMVSDQEHSREVLQILTLFLRFSHGSYFLPPLE